VAVLLLGETLSACGALGALAVCVGVVLIAGGPVPWRRAHDASQRTRLAAGLRWGLLTGVCIAADSVIDADAIKVLLAGPVVDDHLCHVLRVPLMLPLVWRDRAGLPAALRRHWRPALAVAVLSPTAYILVLYAVSLAPLAHVAPAREVSTLLAALVGGRLLGERDVGLRLLGAACIAGGVALLATA
jgi:drug/metabolite transporter (DMT)-like permease